ncbi:hypothetical protein [Melittangium boletus]|uniref:Uncharacterized protein n=1 Tax=Melittangium boletus DSM 14713 TaxID=1294270 RepID=A0A250I9V0_9BACT|nr:hypothetical protein [Melittangium boletus]ATB27932.1 hypothetical protein MEBOL_001377 [Melittangium boletus DSM 14713]
MQPKKPTTPRRRPSSAVAVKPPRRPVGVQTLGPLRYAQVRRVIHQLAASAEREPR